MHEFFRSPTGDIPDELFSRVMSTLGTKQGIAPKDFLHSRQSWHRIREDYLTYCTDPSFVDYFWTVRTMHGPLFTLAEIARNSPPAKVIHSVSTGYAGLLGAMLRFVRKRPYVLTEHGIYTKERKIDLAHAEWIKDAREAFGGGLDDDVSYIRRLWIRFFEGLGRMAYAAADKIIALYEGNRLRQVLGRGRGVPHGGHPQRHRPRALRGPAQQAGVARRLHPGAQRRRPAQGDGPAGAGGPHQGHPHLRAGHAHRLHAHARRRGLGHRPRGRGPGLRPGVPGAGHQPGPGRQGEVPRLPEARRHLAQAGADGAHLDQRGAAAGAARGVRRRPAHGGHRRRLLPRAGRGDRRPRTRPWATPGPSCPSPTPRPPPRRPSSCWATRWPGRRPRRRASPGSRSSTRRR